MLGVLGARLTTHHKNKLLRKCYTEPEIFMESLDKQPKIRNMDLVIVKWGRLTNGSFDRTTKIFL